MNFNTFISRLKQVENIDKIENGYSHIIYSLMYEDVLTSEYMLVDVSTMHRYAKVKDPSTGKETRKAINIELLGKNLCAVPDFVITNRPDFFTTHKEELLKSINRLGCIEIKFDDDKVDEKDRLVRDDGKKGYLETYNNHVIYTNGWKWNYYDGSKEEPIWRFDFTQKEERNAGRYAELLDELSKIEWKN